MNAMALGSAVVMLLCGGLAAGIMFGITVDRLPVWNRLAAAEYATDFRRLLKHVDPMMPILIALAGLGAGLFASQVSGTAAASAWWSMAFQALIIAASLVLAEPVNSKFRRLPEGTPPMGALRYRTFWARFHLVRTFGSVAAFSAAIAAVLTPR
jgi:Domain of unknown function (DUF1772)